MYTGSMWYFLPSAVVLWPLWYLVQMPLAHCMPRLVVMLGYMSLTSKVRGSVRLRRYFHHTVGEDVGVSIAGGRVVLILVANFVDKGVELDGALGFQHSKHGGFIHMRLIQKVCFFRLKTEGHGVGGRSFRSLITRI